MRMLKSKYVCSWPSGCCSRHFELSIVIVSPHRSPRQLLLRRSTRSCLRLHSGNGLILEDADDDAAVLCLAFHSLVSGHLVAFAHRSGGKHSGKRNLALLKQNVGDVLRARLTEFL